MQCRKTIIVTVIAALTLTIAKPAHAEWTPSAYLAAGLCGAGGGVAGYQWGGSSTAHAASAVGMGLLMALLCGTAVDNYEQKAYYNSVNNCVTSNKDCHWQGEKISAETRLVGAEKCPDNPSRQCRYYEPIYRQKLMNGVIILPNGQKVFCVENEKVGGRWVVKKTYETGISEKRLKELQAKYGYGDRDGGGNSNGGGSGSTGIANYGSCTPYGGGSGVFNGRGDCCFVPNDFFQSRYGYVDNNCRSYYRISSRIEEVGDGTRANQAFVDCRLAGNRTGSERAASCTVVIFDHQFLQ